MRTVAECIAFGGEECPGGTANQVSLHKHKSHRNNCQQHQTSRIPSAPDLPTVTPGQQDCTGSQDNRALPAIQISLSLELYTNQEQEV